MKGKRWAGPRGQGPDSRGLVDKLCEAAVGDMQWEQSAVPQSQPVLLQFSRGKKKTEPSALEV